MTLQPISSEQLAIVNALNTHNVVVDSVAGSGKTTTNIYIAKHFPTSKILLLTYNKKLQLETKQKIELNAVTNMDVFTYHAFCVKHYSPDCFTDTQIIKIINKNMPSIGFTYDIILLDEIQDMTPLYYELVCKIIHDNLYQTEPVKLCLLGDRHQSIYDFNLADERFIVYGNVLFNNNARPWKKLQLSTSFRLTNETATFVNNALLHEMRIRTNKTKCKPRYIVCDVFGSKFGFMKGDIPYEEFVRYCNMGYSYDDIFIIAPSVRSAKTPVRLLANKLTSLNIPIYVPNSDEEKLDVDILRNKVVFSTFHQVKGLERKVVLIFGFDESYFKFYKSTETNKTVCPNELYVACTRTKECMTMFHHYQNDFLPFINIPQLKSTSEFVIAHKLKIVKTEMKDKVNDIGVTDLIRHLPSTFVDDCVQMVEVINIPQSDHTFIKIPFKTRQQELYETVTEITGTAIPAYYELYKTNRMTIFKPELSYDFLNTPVTNLMEIDWTVPKLLQVANVWNANRSGYQFKTTQIKTYDWLNDNIMMECTKRLDKLIGNQNLTFEHRMEYAMPQDNKRIIGYVDCIANNNVYEFKTVAKLENIHILQLILYYCMIESNNTQLKNAQLKACMKSRDEIQQKMLTTDNIEPMFEQLMKIEKDIETLQHTSFNYYLFNILDNTLLQIKSSLEVVQEIMRQVIRVKYSTKNKMNDVDFINKHTLIAHKWLK